VRFFDGQFLKEQDFIDEQKYHLDRERRLGKVLRITGIVDGLTVVADGANRVRVTAGTAIDSDGRQVVLAQDRQVDLPSGTFNDHLGIRLLIVYREQATDLATTGSKSERRWLEDPQIVAVRSDGPSSEKLWNDTMPPVVLAQLRLDNQGTVTVDSTVAQPAGVRLPGSVGIGTSPGEYKLTVEGRTRLGGITDYGAATVLSVAPGTVQIDAPNVAGGRLVVDGETGFVGIGAPVPRSALDTGKGVMSGAANDYQRAQFTLSGGGTITWGGAGGRLKWTARFLAISMERGQTFSDGHLSIKQPTGPIAAGNVYDGAARACDASGVVLNSWEALYAVHTIGGDSVAVGSFQIRRYTHTFDAPSNWFLVAVVNADDNTVKLGTGLTLAANTSSSYGSPMPNGTVVMWSGAADAIPGGWRLCNGQNGTPDLRSRFVVGAGGEYTAGQSGEPDQHNHKIAMPGTALTTNAGGAHSHTPPSHWYDRDLLGGVAAAGKEYYSSIDRRIAPVSSSRSSTEGNHTHSVAVSVNSFDSNNSTDQNRPKWYALCYIMKV